MELPSECWHTLIVLEPASVLLEVKEGPFIPAVAKDIAPWAPLLGSSGIDNYVQKHYEYCCSDFNRAA